MDPIDSGDTAWLLVSTGLVLLMIPALALFYGSMVSPAAVVNTMALSFSCLVTISLFWSLVGYSLAFSSSSTALDPFIGGFSYGAFDSSDRVRNNTNVPEYAFFSFQMMFCTITLAVISGALVMRISLWAWSVFSIAWACLVYVPLARWIFYPNGWLAAWGLLDFAGGLPVETASGISGFVAAALLGPGSSLPSQPHNLPLTMLGTGLLYVGWFGFNAGSALSAGYAAARALTNTHLCACAATGATALCDVIWGGPHATLFTSLGRGRVTALGAATGCLVGLVAITPACGYVSQMSAILIGLITAPLCYFAGRALKSFTSVDDRLDCLPVHGCAGAAGVLLTGVLARVSEGSPSDGLLYGNPLQLAKQAVGLIVTLGVCVLGTSLSFGIVCAIGYATGWRVRVSKEAEGGIDLHEHGEAAYHSRSALGVLMGGFVVTAEEMDQQHAPRTAASPPAAAAATTTSASAAVSKRTAGSGSRRRQSSHGDSQAQDLLTSDTRTALLVKS